MGKQTISKPMISSGWLRALLFIIAFGLAAGISIGIYFVSLPMSDSKTQILQNPRSGVIILFIFVLSLIISFVFRRWIDRKSFISLGFQMSGHITDALAGAMLAVFIVGAGALVLNVTGHLKWMDIIFDARSLFLAFGFILLAAAAEEIIFRGYILNNLLDSFPKWPSLLISALLFMIFHWSVNGFFPMANTLIMGLIMGLNYVYSRNLWFSICFHTGWKFMEGPLLGYGGNEIGQTLLQTDIHGDENITGGASGLEGSAILMIVSLLSLLALFLFLQKKFSPQSQPVPGRI